ncbi:DUF3231 family protein [Anaerobacillus alkaliphilus]|uniref:DUF3231 family protein n=1 Tax=Anaerobacillus alkaliphilus TaxID=1548597 RepID=A0A4Q0VSF4_9BACI|nr:DUF3231 family protein [Anaerobacillus alkaliphilus]RXJ00237.1 DUF3231 family protein [Anaerobacillus alkaliphilus]
MEHSPELTSSEVAALWGAYMQNSMSYYVVQHFSNVNEDNDLSEISQKALNNCDFVVKEVKNLFEKDNHAVPIGFTQEDINLEAQRVYSDLFALRYIKYMAAAGTAAAAALLEVLARNDVREFFSKTSQIFMELYNDSCDLLLKKGAFIRSPTIPPMEKAEYIHDTTFLSGLIGGHRPLTVIEMAHISKNTETNSIGRTFIAGFSQTANDPKVRKYMERGTEIAAKHETVFRDILIKEGVPLPSSWDSTISKSIEAPFSDKLMMFQIVSLNELSVSGYGASIGSSLRKDLSGHYTRLVAEILQYGNDGVKLMIENRWLEQPPQNVDREALRNRSN